jgi:HEAT repeats/Tetratricopeptide repeat
MRTADRTMKRESRHLLMGAAAVLVLAMPVHAQISVAPAGNGVPGGVTGGISSGVGAGVSGGVGAGIPGEISGGVYAFTADDQDDRENELYDDGMNAMDDGKWDNAAEKFKQVADMKGKKAEAALYYEARALSRSGRNADALTTLATLEKTYPQSRWIGDAKALEIEIRQGSGQQVSPDAQSDCELKLLAINGLQQMDPEKAVPLLEKILHGGDCPKLANQALFVLAQSQSQQARDAIARLAGGGGNPEVQRRAIQDLGMFGGSFGRDTLAKIYSSSDDPDIKKRVLQALQLAGDKERVLNAAKTEKDPELRAEAIKSLGLMGAREEIWQLYQTETSTDVKAKILQAIWLSGDRQKVGELAMQEKDSTLRKAAIRDLGLMGRDSDPILMQIYNSDSNTENKQAVLQALFLAGDAKATGDLAMKEKDPELRRTAIRNLGLMGKQNDDVLAQIYASDSNGDDKKAVINALFLAGDAKGLVTLARKEQDPAMKKEIVGKLSLMKSPEATDYLMELLNH